MRCSSIGQSMSSRAGIAATVPVRFCASKVSHFGVTTPVPLAQRLESGLLAGTLTQGDHVADLHGVGGDVHLLAVDQDVPCTMIWRAMRRVLAMPRR